MNTEELMKYDKEHILHSLGWLQTTVGYVVEKAKGVILTDTEGKEYIDLAAQAVNVNLGHGRSDIIDAAIEQMNKLVYASTLRGDLTVPSIELGAKLATIVPKGLDHFFWTQTGADTVDCAFRTTHLYWRARGEGKHKIISLYAGYHGTTRGVAGATTCGYGEFQEQPPANGHPGHLSIPNYHCYRCPFHKEYPSCGIECAKFLEYTIVNEGANSVAAFIVEPAQGGGGFISPPPEYFPMVREICSKYNVLLIDDEVMTGFARTGKMFGIEHWDVIPDMMTMSKGIVSGYLPFGALAVSAEIHDALKGTFYPIGSTESGNPVCCAVASKCIDIYKEEHIPEHVAEVGQHVRKRMEKEFLSLPFVGDISGLGLMLGFDIVTDKKTKGMPGPQTKDLLDTRGDERGIYQRILENRVCIGPPCTITQEEADRGLDILFSILTDLKLEEIM